eukprot:TRINITY_DN1853_c0_g2_i3.p1 TRINITY_DN1853_c0_g2~~TRINITY_DN1853_c0_g2_i3.p1  ORF type:complete len:602 (-),score=67.60 TRINITY_DN1853_c0_g2_i3:51-1670(-)
MEEDLKRIMEGDTSPILTCEQVIALYASSGTSSGKRKLVPATTLRPSSMVRASEFTTAFKQLSPVGTAAAQGLRMLLATVGKTSHSPGGLPIASISTFFYKDPASIKRWCDIISSPVEVVHCEDYRQSTYCHLLCGLLKASEVTSFSSVLASTVATGFSLLEELWPEVSRDIETGELNSLVTDPAARAAVTKLLSEPNQELADFVRAECGKKSWRGILLRLWPHAKYIDCIATGSMLQYVDYLNFLSGAQLPILSVHYAGSEGHYGFNPCLWNSPHDTFYVMFHTIGIYFEFIKSQQDGVPDVDKGQQATLAPVVGLSGVRQGEEYELVVTNGEGLWRYKVGDVLQCVGFYHGAPKFKMVGRKNVVLSIHTDKTEEKELQEAVSRAANRHLPPADARLHDFTSCASLDTVPGHYVLFWEISSTTGEGEGAAHTRVSESALADACFTMETALGEPYRRGRIIGAIAPLELRIVRPGTFEHITQQAVDRGVAPPQFKTSRVYDSGSPGLALLNAAVVASSRSRQSPPHATLNPVDNLQHRP